MRSRRSRHNKSSTSSAEYIESVMNLMFAQSKAQFGDAVKAHWFYEGELCPGCLANPIGVVKFKGEDSLAINGFMYRERGVLIGYFLCQTCVVYIFDEAQKHPYKQTPLHAKIENNLQDAYHKYLMKMNA